MTQEALDIPESTERICFRCKETRPLAMFYIFAEEKRAKREGKKRFQYPCRLCQREINLTLRKDRQAHTDRVKMESGCVDCGIRSDHPEIYDFDHIDPSLKVNTISNFLTKGTWEDLLAEIAKCEVVCSNCHRIRTRSRKQASFGQDRKMRTPRVEREY